MIEFDEEKQKTKLADLRKKDEEEYMQMIASQRSIPYVNLHDAPIDTDALRLVLEPLARSSGVAPFTLIAKKLSVAVSNPDIKETADLIKSLTDRGYIITVYLASKPSLEFAWSKYKDLSFAYETHAGALDISNEQITDLVKNVRSIEDIKKMISDVLTQKKSYRITRIVEIIVAGALSLEASDIHIEPEEENAGLRFRLDGVLNEILKFDLDTFNLILSRIKLLSGLKINIKSEAQDGRFSVKINESDIEIRTSLLPGSYAESIVLRILDPKSISVPLESLGMEPKLLELIAYEIAKPDGMILNTGPTGSGKTTTLYAFLRKVHNPQIKIITIENPVEYHLPGIVQTQAEPDKGYTFELGLRSALRQDPDIIMIGEIRDQETASIAVNAALTGHMVFSTLHTNDAAGTFPRMIDLGVNPKILCSAITIAMAQRLVRKLCVKCRKQVKPAGEVKEKIDRVFASIKDEGYKDLIKNDIFEAVGCVECNNTGYKGRIGIFEAIETDEAVEKVVNENPSEREIRTASLPQNIINMKQDGVIKILRGTTSIAELERVIILDDERKHHIYNKEEEEIPPQDTAKG